MKQISPLDHTGILQTDVTILRTGLLTVKGLLAGARMNAELKTEDFHDVLQRCIQAVDQTVMELKKDEDLKSVNT